MKIVVLEAGVMTPGGLSLDVYNQFGEVVLYHTTKQCDVIKRIADADIILLNKLIIDKEVMDACPNLKYIGLFATGFNTYTLAMFARRSVVDWAPIYSVRAISS